MGDSFVGSFVVTISAVFMSVGSSPMIRPSAVGPSAVVSSLVLVSSYVSFYFSTVVRPTGRIFRRIVSGRVHDNRRIIRCQ